MMRDHRRRFAVGGQRHRLVERQIAGDAASRERFRAPIDGQEEQIRPHAAVFFTCPANGIVSPEGMIEIIAFGLSGAFAALAGIVLAARLSSGSPDLANQLLLSAMAAVVVGGTAITGGVGSIGRTMVGAFIVSIVRIGMTYIGVDIFAQQIVFGAALIFAVFVTIDRSKLPIIK
jgi:Branched-chain amino acid transport system / permease component